MSAQFDWCPQLLQKQLRDLQRRLGRGDIEEQYRKLIAAPPRQHAVECRNQLPEAARSLDHQLIAGRVAQHVVDEFESRDIHDDDCNSMMSFRSYVTQCPIELIHEIAPVRQSRERIVKSRVIEGLLQVRPLLHLRRQLLIDRAQTELRCGCDRA